MCPACTRKRNAGRDAKRRALLLGSGISEEMIQRRLIGGKRPHTYDARPRLPLPIACERCGEVRQVTSSKQCSCPKCGKPGFPLPRIAVRELVRLSDEQRLDRLVGEQSK